MESIYSSTIKILQFFFDTFGEGGNFELQTSILEAGVMPIRPLWLKFYNLEVVRNRFGTT